MKKSIITFLIFISISTNLYAEPGWFPFVIPSKLPPESPVNIGKLVLDAPAGKHGFVTRDGEHFFFDDGTRARFWGVNINGQSNFPTYAEAEKMADRIAFFGFNIVHLQTVDIPYDGIFGNYPYSCSQQDKSTRSLDVERLDRFDYFVSKLKARGIYIYMDLLTVRRFSLADGVPFAEELLAASGGAAKPASFYDQTLIDLQKEYASQYLDRTNKYTGLKYSEEPALVMVEITNENSLFRYFVRNLLDPFDPTLLYVGTANNIPLPNHYLTLLDDEWNKWLIQKYGSVANVATSWIPDTTINPIEFLANSSELNSWTKQITAPAIATVSALGQNNTHPFEIRVSQAEEPSDPLDEPLPYRVQIRQDNINFTNNTKYKITFSAKTNIKNTTLQVLLKDNTSNKTLLSKKYNVLTNYNEYSILYTSDANYSNVRFALQFGDQVKTFTIKDISLADFTQIGAESQEMVNGEFNFLRPAYNKRDFYTPARVQDLYSFFMDVETLYINDMTNYVKTNLGFRVVSGNNSYYSLASIKAQTASDFINDHIYWDLPFKVDGRHDLGTMQLDSIFQRLNNNLNNDLSDNPVLGLTSSRVKGMPFVVSEWNNAYPNPYIYEMPVIMAAYSNFLDFDGALVHTLRSETNTTPENSPLNFFYIMNDPLRMSINGLGSLIYNKSMIDIADSNKTITLPYSNADIFDNINKHSTYRTFGDKFTFNPLTALSHKFDIEFLETATLPTGIPVETYPDLITSDTSQLQWSKSDDIFTINTNNVQGMTGFLPNRQPITLNNLEVTSNTKGSVLMVPLDQNTILSNSQKILLYAAGEVKNTGSSWNPDGTYNWGTWPPIMQTINMTVTVKTGFSDLKVFALDETGLYNSEITANKIGNDYSFTYPVDTVWVVLTNDLIAPRVDISATVLSGKAPLQVVFTLNTFDPDGQISSITWDFGDNSISNLPNPTKIYPNEGMFDVNVSVTDNDGLITEKTIQIDVKPENSAPNFLNLTDKTVTVGENIKFQVTASDPDNSPNLISNPSFEGGLTGWNIIKPKHNTPDIDIDNFYSGESSVHFFDDNNDLNCTTNNGVGIEGEFVSVTADADYSISAYAKGIDVTIGTIKSWHRFKLTGWFYDVDKNAITEVNASLPFDLGTYNWKTFTKNVTAPIGAAFFKISNIGIVESGTGETWIDNVTFKEINPNDQVLTVSALNLPTGATFDQNTGIFSWAPTYEHGGEHNITFTVTDDQGLSTSKTIKITVPFLSISIDKTSWSIGNIETGTTKTMTDLEKITVTNNGNVNTTLSLIVTEPVGWTAGSTNSTGINQFVLSGLFTGNSIISVLSSDFNTVDSDDVLPPLFPKRSGSDEFSNVNVSSEDGVGVIPGDTRTLWLRFDAPTQSSVETEQAVSLTVTAESE